MIFIDGKEFWLLIFRPKLGLLLAIMHNLCDYGMKYQMDITQNGFSHIREGDLENGMEMLCILLIGKMTGKQSRITDELQFVERGQLSIEGFHGLN